MDISASEFIVVSSWVGTFALAVAGPFIDKLSGKSLQLLGIVCLTLQALHLGQVNLILLNFFSLVGFGHSFFKQWLSYDDFTGGRGEVFCSRLLDSGSASMQFGGRSRG